eukprot:gene29387-38474_t
MDLLRPGIYVEELTAFISHANNNKFVLLLNTLNAHFKDAVPSEVYVYIDIFTINQNKVVEDLKDGQTLKATIECSRNVKVAWKLLIENPLKAAKSLKATILIDALDESSNDSFAVGPVVFMLLEMHIICNNLNFIVTTRPDVKVILDALDSRWKDKVVTFSPASLRGENASAAIPLLQLLTSLIPPGALSSRPAPTDLRSAYRVIFPSFVLDEHHHLIEVGRWDCIGELVFRLPWLQAVLKELGLTSLFRMIESLSAIFADNGLNACVKKLLSILRLSIPALAGYDGWLILPAQIFGRLRGNDLDDRLERLRIESSQFRYMNRMWPVRSTLLGPSALQLVLWSQETHATCLLELSNGVLVSGHANGALCFWNISNSDGEGKVLLELQVEEMFIQNMWAMKDGLDIIFNTAIQSDKSFANAYIANIPSGVVQSYENRAFSLILRDGKIVLSTKYTRARLMKEVYCEEVPSGRILRWEPNLDEVEVVDVTSGEMESFQITHSKKVTAVQVLHDGRVVSASEDKTLKIWDMSIRYEEDISLVNMRTEKVIHVLLLHDGLVVTGSTDNTIRLWNSGEFVRELGQYTGHPQSLFKLRSGHVVIAEKELRFLIWDPITGNLKYCEHQQGRVLSVIELADGKLASVASMEQCIRIWDPLTGRCINELYPIDELYRCKGVHQELQKPLRVARDGSILSKTKHQIPSWLKDRDNKSVPATEEEYLEASLSISTVFDTRLKDVYATGFRFEDQVLSHDEHGRAYLDGAIEDVFLVHEGRIMVIDIDGRVHYYQDDDDDVRLPSHPVVAKGFQNDCAGELACCVVSTPYGRIPGKYKSGTAWYSYGGREEYTTEEITIVSGHLLPMGSPPSDAAHGFQLDSDGAGDLWCAIAHTQWGTIPGKAKGHTCWYPYGGKEHITSDFQYVVCKKD